MPHLLAPTLLFAGLLLYMAALWRRHVPWPALRYPGQRLTLSPAAVAFLLRPWDRSGCLAAALVNMRHKGTLTWRLADDATVIVSQGAAGTRSLTPEEQAVHESLFEHRNDRGPTMGRAPLRLANPPQGENWLAMASATLQRTLIATHGHLFFDHTIDLLGLMAIGLTVMASLALATPEPGSMGLVFYGVGPFLVGMTLFNWTPALLRPASIARRQWARLIIVEPFTFVPGCFFLFAAVLQDGVAGALAAGVTGVAAAGGILRDSYASEVRAELLAARRYAKILGKADLQLLEQTADEFPHAAWIVALHRGRRVARRLRHASPSPLTLDIRDASRLRDALRKGLR